MTLAISLLCTLLVLKVQAISTAWRPAYSTSILHQEPIYSNGPSQSLFNEGSSLLSPHDQDRCALYKVAMNQQLYFEVGVKGDGNAC